MAVKCLEDDPAFDAGHGSVLNAIGEIEMDAIIVDGRNLKFGAVAAVQNISNPVSLARKVMEETDHVMLVGKGANQFAVEVGIPEVNPMELVNSVAKQDWENFKKYKTVVRDHFNHPEQSPPGESGPKQATAAAPVVGTHSHETVGTVAVDLKGNFAAATSTGGITLKRVGRVGDVPLVGSGAYCENSIGGVSCTGHGESIAKVVLAKRAFSLIEFQGLSAQSALEQSLEYMWRCVGGKGGMIMISKNGDIAKSFTTARMSWASIDQKGILESGLSEPRLNLTVTGT